jgi:transposase-like protein
VLQRFEDWVKRHLLTAFLAHVDETSININGKKHWLHVICKMTLYPVLKALKHRVHLLVKIVDGPST